MSSKHTILPDRAGRKSGLRRLVYRPQTTPDSQSKDWQATKDRLRRTVARIPEVVIKVTGGGPKIAGVLRYMNYISRNGMLIAADENGQRLSGQDAIQNVHASWDLDLQRTHDRRGEALHQSFNIIFSMPAKTDPEKLFEAVQAVAQEQFVGRQYVMALHTPETDPSDNPPPHPHVHVIVRAEGEDGQRLHIRKATLRIWREAFAAELRARGIEANATSRAERGVSLKARGSAEYHIKERGDVSTAEARRFAQAAADLRRCETEAKPWELAMAARRRDVLKELTRNAATLRNEGDVELAEQVERFARELPPLDTERRRMQRALVEQVNARLQRQQLKNAELPDHQRDIQ
jgi:polyhydroxyalkanoate synthesis regulator phasin